MYYYIAILPNTNDDWETDSPFSTLLDSGQLGYILSNITDSDLVDYKLISSKLLDLSTINHSIDIFSGSNKELSGKVKVSGIGGIADSGDFSFTIEKTNINFIGLIGRQVKVVLDLTNEKLTDIGESGVNIVSVGKINGVKPGKFDIEIVCRGLLNQYKNREIGTITNYESEVYKSKIIPLMYGDLTDSHAFSPVALNTNIGNFPDIIIDSQSLESIDEVVFWDNDTKTSISHNDLTKIGINVNKNQISLAKPTDITLLYSRNNSDTDIYYVDPPKIAFSFSATPSPALDTTSFYYFDMGSYNVGYKFLEIKDGYYVFTCPASSWLPTSYSGTLTKVSGTGPSTLTFTWHSELLDDVIIFEQSGQNSETVPIVDSARPQALILKIDSEYMLCYHKVIYQETDSGVNRYSNTRIEVCRGYNGSTAASHSAGAEISITNGNLSASKWNFWFTMWVCGVSGFYNDDADGELVLTSGDLDELTQMYRLGSAGDEVVFTATNTGVNDNIMYIDLIFPKMSVEASVIEAYMLGSYEVLLDENNPHVNMNASIAVQSGGSKCIEGLAYLYTGSGAGTYWLYGAGIGYHKKVFYSGGTWNIPFKNDTGVNRTLSALSFGVSDAVDVIQFYFDSSVDGTDCYSLKNLIEQVNGEYYRDIELGTLATLCNSARLTLKLQFHNSNTTEVSAEFHIANPGLLLNIEINPLESEVFVKGVGRDALETPNDILCDILDRELDFTNIHDVVSTLRDSWEMAFTIYGNPIHFDEIAQKVCQQSGMILADDLDGKFVLATLDIPASLSGLTQFSDSDILLGSDNLPTYTEEYTTIDRLITDIDVNYQFNIPGDFYGSVRKSASISNISTYLTDALNITEIDQKATLDLDYIRDTNSVDYLVQLMVKYMTTPLRVLTLNLTIDNYNLYLGQWVKLNTSTISGTSGHPYLVVGYDLDLVESVLKVKLIEQTLPVS